MQRLQLRVASTQLHTAVCVLAYSSVCAANLLGRCDLHAYCVQCLPAVSRVWTGLTPGMLMQACSCTYAIQAGRQSWLKSLLALF